MHKAMKQSQTSLNLETTTDAGSAINTANTKGIVNTVSSATGTFSLNITSYNIVAASEIPSGCVLCICSGVTGTSIYDATTSNGGRYSANFSGSNLDTVMTNVYNNIKSSANNAIQSTSLTTYMRNDSAQAVKYTHSEYLFPLATSTNWSNDGYAQNYCVETYLNTNKKRDVDTYWWLRSGGYWADRRYTVATVSDAGTISIGNVALDSYGVRPCFVLKL